MGTTQEITATFSEPMNSGDRSSPPGTFTVRQGRRMRPIDGTVTYDATNNIAIFSVTRLLPSRANRLPLSITTAAESVRTLAAGRVTIRGPSPTGVGPDTTPPLVSSTNPANSATAVATNQTVVATFDKGMDSTHPHPHDIHLDGTGSNPRVG